MSALSIESHLRLLLVAWAVIVVASLVMGRLAARLRQPVVVGEMLAGLLLGPSFLGALQPAAIEAIFPASIQQSLQVLGKVGILLLMFQVGMEFDFGHLRTASRTVLGVAVAGLALPLALGLLVAPWLHARFAQDVARPGFVMFTCIALSISALPVLARILLEMDLSRTRIGVIAISAAAIDDVVGWMLLATATAIITAQLDGSRIALQIAGLAAFVALVPLVVGPALRRWWRAAVARAGDESRLDGAFLGVLVATLLLCCVATNALGVFSIFGAFLLGVALHAERPLVAAWRRSIAPFVVIALVPIFFTTTGQRTRIGSLADTTAWLGLLVVIAVGVAGKLLGCFVAARATGSSPREAACIGAFLNTRGLMGLVAINAGADLGVIPPAVFTMLVLMALITTAMTGPLVRLWLPADARVSEASAAS